MVDYNLTTILLPLSPYMHASRTICGKTGMNFFVDGKSIVLCYGLEKLSSLGKVA